MRESKRYATQHMEVSMKKKFRTPSDQELDMIKEYLRYDHITGKLYWNKNDKSYIKKDKEPTKRLNTGKHLQVYFNKKQLPFIFENNNKYLFHGSNP